MWVDALAQRKLRFPLRRLAAQTPTVTLSVAQAERAEAADRVADLEAALLGAQRDGDAAERRAELAERQSAEAHRLILDMQARMLAGV